MRNTTELLTDIYNPQVYVWRGQSYGGWDTGWQDTPAPEGGETCILGVLNMKAASDYEARDESDLRYVMIPATSWSDYGGSTVDRSNCRSLLRDYPEDFVHVTGGHGTELLVIRVGVEIEDDLYDQIVDLGDGSRTFYDEGDFSALEREIEEEDWDNFGRDEFVDQVRNLARGEDCEDGVPELDDKDRVDEFLWLIQDEGYYLTWYAETAVSGAFSDFDRAAEMCWEHIKDARMAELGAWARNLSAPIPGQLALL